MELTHKGLGHVRSGAPPTRGPRKAHPTQVLRLRFETWVPRTQTARIRPLPTLPRGDGLAAEKGSLGSERPWPGKEHSPNDPGSKSRHHSGRRTLRGIPTESGLGGQVNGNFLIPVVDTLADTLVDTL